MSQENITHSEYLAHPSYGASDLFKMSRSFAYYKWRKENPEKPTRALVIGSATHLMLESALVTGSSGSLTRGILVYKDGSSLTNGFKKFQAENKGFYCVDEDEAVLCEAMTRALMEDREVMGYLRDAAPELTILAKYPQTDVKCKVRPDWLHKARGVSINIKTTNDASESAFLYAAKDYGYDWQSALYCSILTEEFGRSFDEIHILVEKVDDGEPPRIKIYSFGDDTLAFARSQIMEIMAQIPRCERSGIWPNNPTQPPIVVDLPLHFRKIALT